ncbi:class I SAM-dependent methyltransferase [Paracoccus sp. IB05]|uniref:class I SAM-dependent methyltransferase n=1 Tax=Paracoccus sp. IB05 TaxID=2779367 RepID=UPI0018E8FB44|nr:class I SAM-dependent methyltransferase [Paracoccus sp. IB05]MBJ2152574.1 hypothetical protein [Paracoccus sp. IB05]
MCAELRRDARDASHEQRVSEQIRQYEEKGNMHDELSGIFDFWSQTFIRPRITEVTGHHNHIDIYAHAFIESIKATGNPNIGSIGSGDGGLENTIARHMIHLGFPDFKFVLLELSPIQNARAMETAREAGIADKFVPLEVDLNNWVPDRKFGAMMAHHALHHIVELEKLFETTRNAMEDAASFVTFDVIGRNGHMRWPEAYKIINSIWKFLPPERRTHLQLNFKGEDFLNHDCSGEGFEGIRAQDILPLLVRYFHFDTFIGWGNLAETFVDRGYGHHYNANDPRDAAFITFIEELNEILTDLGYLKPTQIYARLRKQPVENPRFYKGRTPESMIRVPD